MRLFSLLICLSLFCTASVHATSLGDTCAAEELGTTTKETGDKNLIACLKDDSGNFVWKAMTVQNLSIHCPTREVVQGFDSEGKVICSKTSKTVSVSVPYLQLFHTGCTDPFTGYLFCAAACHRLCANTCANGGGNGCAGAIDSGLDYSGGTLTEWDYVTAACSCSY